MVTIISIILSAKVYKQIILNTFRLKTQNSQKPFLKLTTRLADYAPTVELMVQ